MTQDWCGFNSFVGISLEWLLADWRRLLARNPTDARQVPCELLVRELPETIQSRQQPAPLRPAVFRNEGPADPRTVTFPYLPRHDDRHAHTP
jgi:hypothetical protein